MAPAASPDRYPAFAAGGNVSADGHGAGTGKGGIRLAGAGSSRAALPPGKRQARLAKARQCGQSALHPALSAPQAPQIQAGSSAVVVAARREPGARRRHVLVLRLFELGHQPADARAERRRAVA